MFYNCNARRMRPQHSNRSRVVQWRLGRELRSDRAGAVRS